MSGQAGITPAQGGRAIPGAPHRMALVRTVARGWWVFLLRGVVSVLFGVLAFLAPGFGLAAILAFLAAWMAVDGASAIYQAIHGGPAAGQGQGQGQGKVWLWIDGIISLLAAAGVLLAPGVSALGLVLLTGAWLVVAGAARLMLAFRMRSVLLGLLGAMTVLIGAWLVADPGPSLLALIWVVGIQAVTVGLLMIGLGWRLRRIHHDPHPDATPARP